ncbi:magnesium transporter [Paenactinomyces guangxiensis]|uniref:Magnesium transporter MgtE n=2 Tax=Paenactinomyces guangxiensis TaxID=1490290 RepID=A0A7W1WSG6_9BACL|nr:magnesium transporter [Paenactinomyces guangxiensis]MBA4495234.1 magnesium transporter [Paenactinomyces guangxiensis]MBH8592318.1 magnesium transporter [Paenactinomyces guangxiensis]
MVQQEIASALKLSSTGPEKLLDLLQQLQPYDLSEILREMEERERIGLISNLPVAEAAEALEYLEPELQYQILNHLHDSAASPLLKQMSSDTVVDMLLAVHPLQAEKMLRLLPEDYRIKINNLMTYPEYTAGSLMTVDYISARAHWSGEQTLRHIRKVGLEAEIISYIYVTSIRGELVGIVSLKEIILASPHTRLSEIATTDVISVPAEMEQEEVAGILARYSFYALPVVDNRNRLIGIITYDDVVEVIQEEATEDFQKLGGSQPLSEPYFKTSIWSLFSKRIIWLLVLFIGGAYTANVLEMFQSAVDKVVALSFFIPLLIGTGGNTGSQIVTTLVRALGVGEVKFKDVFRVIHKELITGVLLGLSLGLVAYVRAILMGVEINIGYVVAISALFIVLWASVVSAVLPLLLHRLKIDPAVVSGPLITTLVDGTGLIIYFTIARMILHI